MKLSQIALTLAIAGSLALPVRAALVITEACANEVGSDTTGEWIEIFNTGPAAVSLTNYKIGDEETSGGTGATEAMHVFPAGASIAPGAIQIIAVSATRFQTVYGFLPTYEVTATDGTVPDLTIYSAWDPDGGAINMSNTNDQALILDPSDVLVDAVSWGNTFAFNPGIDLTVATQDGQSFVRKNAYVDTNTAGDWQFGPSAATAAGRSTPGTVPTPEPASSTLLAGLGLLAGAMVRRVNRRP